MIPVNAIVEFLQSAGVFLLGLLVRFLGLVLVVAAYAIPILVIYGLYLAFKWMRERQLGFREIGGLTLVEARHYAPGHTWLARRLGGQLRVGLDDLAQHLLPGTTFVKLPCPGSRVEAGSPVATIACGDRIARIPAPVTGTVTAINAAVVKDPDLVHSSPYGRGWLFAVKPAGQTYRTLPTGAGARIWFRQEEGRLSRFIEGELGLAAADGGELVFPAPALLPPEKWQALIGSFLRA